MQVCTGFDPNRRRWQWCRHKYDQTPPVATTILVNETGIRDGVTAKLWERTKVYPNKLWADFKLTAGRQESSDTARWGRRDRVATS